jgi:hypothetical protein
MPAERSKIAEPRQRTNAELVEEYRASKAEERAQLEAQEREAAQLEADKAPLENLLERIDLENVPKDTLRRLRGAVIVEEHDDGTVSFKHDRQIVDDARLASRDPKRQRARR